MKALLLTTCSLFALVTVPASAQNAAPGPALNANPGGGPGQNQSQGAAAPNEPARTGQLETIVVTAQKRSERAQKVPAAVATVSPSTLSREGVRDFADISKSLPDVHVDDVVGATNISIRGVRESAAGPTSDSPTAVHLDGVYVARPTGLNGMFYDLQRIEELPGPQGTLYGRNATGGVMNLITNKPSDQFGGYVEAEGGNLGLYRFNGAISVPINDYIAVRGAFHILHNDGWVGGFDDTDQKGGRISARVKLTPDATLLMSADYQTARSHGPASVLVVNTYPSIGGPPLVTPPVSPFTLNPVLFPLGLGPSFESSETFGAMAELDYNLGPATLTAQLGARRLALNTNQLNLGTLPPPMPVTSVGNATTPAESTSYSGEVRLASTSKLPFEWVAGLYYFTEKNGGTFCAHPDLSIPSCVIEVGNPFQRTLSYAVFGQGTYTPPILDQKLHLTFGARYNQDKKNASVFTTAAFANGGAGGLLQNEPNLEASFQATTYLLKASYDITPENLVYASNSTGFRAGGFAYGLTPEYKPETIMAYEIGSKNRFLHNTLQVNVAVYHYIYKNQETNVTSPPLKGSPPFVPFSDISVQSIGKAHYTGVGLDIEYAITPDDRIETNVQYEDATYARFVIPGAYVTSAALGLNGQPTGEAPGSQTGLQVLDTPPWSGTFAYDHSVTALGGTFDGRVAVQFSDVQHFLVYPTDTLQYKYGSDPAYARADLSLSYAPDRGGWKVTAYVNNVTDEVNFTGNNYENTFGSGQVTANVLQPRTFGLILNATF